MCVCVCVTTVDRHPPHFTKRDWYPPPLRASLRALLPRHTTSYQDQITALLGHNGAGKSTTMSVLTGLIRPTGGGCDVLGLSIQRDMPLIRQFVGLCPQHNVLFPRLSVDEHLRCFGVIKGVGKDDEALDAAVDAALKVHLLVQQPRVDR